MTETDEENMYDMLEDFEDMGMDPRKHSSRGGPQGRRHPHHLNEMGSFDQDDFGSRGPLIRGGRQGGRDTGRHHLDEMGGFDQKDFGSRGPLTRGGRQGERDTGRRDSDGIDWDEDILPSVPRNVDPDSELRRLKALLAIEREGKNRADRSLCTTSRNQGANAEKSERATHRIEQIKIAIFKIDPHAEEIKNTTFVVAY